uniref:Integrase core domain containing protein n=1 Tax=Solanum tuberosum TaxID=4113 RepID=M1E1B9_SOLTU
MVQLLHTNGQFIGLSHEDPTIHIQNFLEISDTYTPAGVNVDYGNPEWNRGGAKPVIQKTAGMLEVDVVTTLTTQIDAMQNMMNTHFSNLSLGQQPAQVNVVQQPPTWYEIYGGGDHSAETQGQNQYRPQGNAHRYQQQAPREQPNKQPNNMSMDEMLKKIKADQAQLTADVRNNQLATQNLEKQFWQFASAQNSRPQGGLPGNIDPSR